MSEEYRCWRILDVPDLAQHGYIYTDLERVAVNIGKIWFAVEYDCLSVVLSSIRHVAFDDRSVQELTLILNSAVSATFSSAIEENKLLLRGLVVYFVFQPQVIQDEASPLRGHKCRLP